MKTDEMHRHAEATVAAACTLLGQIKLEGCRVRELSKPAYGELLDAHAMMTGTLHLALVRRNAIPGVTTESTSRRLLLLASFVQGIDLCETSISEGLYLQAAALLKQELETISAMEEVKAESRRDRRTPNVAYAPWSLGQLYGALNDAAHVGHGETLQAVLALSPKGEARPVAMTPQFSEGIACRLFGVHVAMLTWACWELHCLHSDLYGEGLTSQELCMLLGAVETLKRAKVLGEPDFETASGSAELGQQELSQGKISP